MADYILSVTGAELENRLIRPLPVNQGGTGNTVARDNVEVSYITTTASGHSISVVTFPYLGMCFIRASFTVSNTAVSANTWFSVASVSSSLAPLSRTALAISAVGGGGATMNPDGVLQVSFGTAQTASQARSVFVSGWWIVPA